MREGWWEGDTGEYIEKGKREEREREEEEGMGQGDGKIEVVRRGR